MTPGRREIKASDTSLPAFLFLPVLQLSSTLAAIFVFITTVAARLVLVLNVITLLCLFLIPCSRILLPIQLNIPPPPWPDRGINWKFSGDVASVFRSNLAE